MTSTAAHRWQSTMSCRSRSAASRQRNDLLDIACCALLGGKRRAVAAKRPSRTLPSRGARSSSDMSRRKSMAPVISDEIRSFACAGRRHTALDESCQCQRFSSPEHDLDTARVSGRAQDRRDCLQVGCSLSLCAAAPRIRRSALPSMTAGGPLS